jgi:hypothetical protein
VFFLEMYRSENIHSPDLIWNKSVKEEFKLILIKESEKCEKSELWEGNPYKNFKYTEQSDGLVIGGVSVRLLNKDMYFTLTNPDEFLGMLVDDLKNTKRNGPDTFELIKAMRNCISSTGISEVSDQIMSDIFSLLPEHVSMEVDENNSKASTISMLMLETLSHAIKKTFMIESIIENNGLCQILVNILHKNENEHVSTDSIIL